MHVRVCVRVREKVCVCFVSRARFIVVTWALFGFSSSHFLSVNVLLSSSWFLIIVEMWFLFLVSCPKLIFSLYYVSIRHVYPWHVCLYVIQVDVDVQTSFA